MLEKLKNEIEAFVFDAQDRLEQRDYKLCSTEDERVAITSKLSEASDWLIEQEDSTPRKVVVVSCHQLYFMSVTFKVLVFFYVAVWLRGHSIARVIKCSLC